MAQATVPILDFTWADQGDVCIHSARENVGRRRSPSDPKP
jgi:hypothetical protein